MEKNIFFNSEDNTLTIKKNLLNSIWFECFGGIQKDILNITGKVINVKMDECLMISPTPFLSLLLTLTKAKEQNGCEINIFLPNDDAEKKRKFLNYCSRDGFIDIINDISENKYDAVKFNSYDVIGNDNFENIYKAQIIHLKECSNNIKEVVDKILNQINDSNLNINPSQKLYVNITIRNILQELIDNVDKHAYDKGDKYKYMALYIRMRYATDDK